MQTVAMLGDLRIKSEDVDVKLTMKHSNPGSTLSQMQQRLRYILKSQIL